MSRYIHFNGTIIKEAAPLVTADNRGLRYGDGLFETMKLVNGTLLLATLHFERLFHGMAVLGIDIPAFFSPGYFTECISALCKKNNLQQAARIRLSIFRGNGTPYTLAEEFPCVVIQAQELPGACLEYPSKGLRTGLYPDVRKSCDVLANLKSNNYLPYIMAARYARQNGWDDAFLLNAHHRICEATIANVFWVKDNVIYTPPLTEGCVAGVMRRHLMEKVTAAGYIFREKEFLTTIPEEADEIFLTNALYGIRWVQQYHDRQYDNRVAVKLYNGFIKNYSTA